MSMVPTDVAARLEDEAARLRRPDTRGESA